MIGLLDPVKAFTPPHQGVRESWWSSLLRILQHYSQCLEQLADLESKSNGPSLRHVAACSDDGVISVILDFAEHGDLPPNYDFEEEDEEEEQTDARAKAVDPPTQTSAQKAMGKAKASIVSFLTSMCWEIPYDPASPIWIRMRTWLSRGPDGRDDLMNAALMCFANGVRSGECLSDVLD